MIASAAHGSAIRRISVLFLTALFLSILVPSAAALASASLTTPASASISVDTAGSGGGTGTYTTLSGPVISEGAAGDITPGGDAILQIPTGWDLASSTVTVTRSSLGASSCPITVTSPATVNTTTDTITTTIGGTASANATQLCRISFSGIRVRPSTPSLPNVGTIDIGFTGTAGISGIATIVGTLTAVAGAPVVTFTAPATAIIATSATAFSPQPAVHVQDQFGHVRQGDSIVLSIRAGSTVGGTLTCTSLTVPTDSSGNAAFAACQIDKTGTYRLRATDTTSLGTGTADSPTITVSPGAAAKLGFSVQPGRGSPGVALIQQPQVAIQDAQGNTVTTAAASGITLAIGTNAGSGTLTCSANPIPTVNGVASFSGCRINNLGVGYTLTASGAYTGAISAPFDVADRLGFTTLPAGAVGGVAFTTQPVVAVKSGASNLAVNDNLTQVTLSISGGPVGAALTCTANPVTVSAGYATFAGCAIDKIGTYTVSASAGGLFLASTTLAVTAGPATKLAFTTQPSTSVVSQLLTPQPVVTIQDAGGNTVSTGTASTSLVTIGIGTNPGGGTLSCAGGLTKAAVAGVASFSGCMIDRAGTGYTLIATSGSLTSATTNAFNVTQPPAQIALSTSASVITWSQPVTLTIQFGTNGAGKTFALQTSPDAFTWTTIATAPSLTNSSGTATFTWTPARNFWYRVSFVGTPDLSAANSNVVRVVVRQIALLRPTLGGKVRTIANGTSITFTTTVRPARPELPKAKVTFTFQLYQAGHLVYNGKRDVYIDSLGLAKWTWRFGTSGEWYVRAIANPTTANANSVWSQIEHYHVP